MEARKGRKKNDKKWSILNQEKNNKTMETVLKNGKKFKDEKITIKKCLKKQ